MRVAALALGLWGLAGAAQACTVDQAALTAYPDSVTVDPDTRGAVARAWFDDPVTRYRHGILGRDTEPETLWIDTPGNHGLCGHALTLDAGHVFEDIAPRLADLDGDGTNEVIVVQSSLSRGAQLAVYRWTGQELRLDAATPHIGRPHRWLAPLGAADLDGDGAMELAYVDRPHLARVLRVWRYGPGALTEVAAVAGLTAHAIGDPGITGGLRDCGTGPEIVTVDAGWIRLIATRLRDGTLTSQEAGRYGGPGDMRAALACE